MAAGFIEKIPRRQVDAEDSAVDAAGQVCTDQPLAKQNRMAVRGGNCTYWFCEKLFLLRGAFP